MSRSMQKQISIYPEHFELIDKVVKKHASFKASEFIRWALEKKLDEYLNENFKVEV